MVLTKTILILEDNLLVLSKLLKELSLLEYKQPYDFSIIILTTYKQVKELINTNLDQEFDVVLLDRDCKLNDSFHIFNIEHFGADKVIAISSVPEYNKQAMKRGVKRVVEKNLADMDGFAKKVAHEIERMLTPSRLLNLLNL